MNAICKTLFSTIILLFTGVAICTAQSYNKYYTNTSTTDLLADVILQESVDGKLINIHLLNAVVFHLTNTERSNSSLPLFEFNNNLYQSAQLHSDKMIKQQFFDHVNKHKKKWREPKDRILHFEPNYTALGENIVENNLLNYKGTVLNYRIKESENGELVYLDKEGDIIEFSTYLELADRLMQQWMNSKPHRENILNKSFSLLGCACAINSDKTPILIRCTQNFGRL